MIQIQTPKNSVFYPVVFNPDLSGIKHIRNFFACTKGSLPNYLKGLLLTGPMGLKQHTVPRPRLDTVPRHRLTILDGIRDGDMLFHLQLSDIQCDTRKPRVVMLHQLQNPLQVCHIICKANLLL